jgi:uncharacterized protein YhbP (UPF0306 family)
VTRQQVNDGRVDSKHNHDTNRMTDILREQALAYLESHNVVTLATHGVQGPWAAALCYVSDGFNLYFLSAATTRHIVNLKTQPQVAATIQEDYTQWTDIRGIQLEGIARPVADGEQATVIHRYQQKFPIVGEDAPKEIARAMAKITWWKLTPERIYFIDNSRGLGHRDEVPLRPDP